VYLAGWASPKATTTDPFVVARATVTLNSPNPNFNLDLALDVLALPLFSTCYDQFDEVLRPQLNLTNGYLYVIVPGRCALFAKIQLPLDPLIHFNSISNYQLFNPLRNWENRKYVSSAVFDPDNAAIYYTLKYYDLAGSLLFSFKADTWVPNAPFADLTRDVTDSETIIVLGTEIKSATIRRFVYIIASGSNWIERLEVKNDFTFDSISFAYITEDINQISSAYFYYPYLYFTTYEPDAKLVRISTNNFCAIFCGANAFCDLGTCYCQDGFVKDITDPKLPCKLLEVVKQEVAGRQSQGAAAALGVLFAFSLLAAIAGWVLWWKARNIQSFPSA